MSNLDGDKPVDASAFPVKPRTVIKASIKVIKKDGTVIEYDITPDKDDE